MSIDEPTVVVVGTAATHPRATRDARNPDAGTARRQAVNDIPGVTELRLVVRAADHD